MRKIETLDELHELYGQPVKTSLDKVADHLTPLYREWILQSRFCILSTAGEGGTDGSPRGDDGPVIEVLDDKSILLPDWQGNNRLDTLRNIVTDGRVSLLFMVPPSNTVVRINGTAYLTDDEPTRLRFERRGRHPATVMVITIHEVYTQCAKALMRSGLWGRNDAESLPTTGQILAEMTNGVEGGVEYDKSYVARAQDRMW